MKLRNSKYYYLTGKIRFLEKFLLTKNDINRMIEAPSAKVAFRVFNDMDYSSETLNLSPQEYEQALDQKLKRIKRVLKKTVPDAILMKILFYRYDFHNIKVFLKRKYCGAPVEESDVFGISMLSADLLWHIIEDEHYIHKEIPVEISELIERAERFARENFKPSAIDIFLDKEFFALMTILAKKSKNKFIKNMIGLQIDIFNIKLILRGFSMGFQKKDLLENLIAGGNFVLKLKENLDIQKLAELIQRELKPLGGEKHYIAISLAVGKFLENKSFAELEQNLEEAEILYFAPVKIQGCGVEIVIAYVFNKLNMIRNIRLIMTGKFNGFNPEEIRGMLRGI